MRLEYVKGKTLHSLFFGKENVVEDLLLWVVVKDVVGTDSTYTRVNAV